MANNDVIAELLGQIPQQVLRRPVTAQQTQKTYEAIFTRDESGNFPLKDRFAIAAFIAILHGVKRAEEFYLEKLKLYDDHLGDIVVETAQTALSHGPYGSYPPGPLSRENKTGLIWQAEEKLRQQLGSRLIAAFEHSHLLVYHPRDASRMAINTLIVAGWNANTIVTLSQLIAFLAYQLRVINGFEAFNKS